MPYNIRLVIERCGLAVYERADLIQRFQSTSAVPKPSSVVSTIKGQSHPRLCQRQRQLTMSRMAH